LDIKKFISVASYAASSGMLIKCPYCGAKTISLSDHCICSWCEALIHKKMSSQNLDLAESVDAIRSNYSSKQYDASLAACDKAFSLSKSPWFIYLKGIVQLSASNNETSMISYDKPGFMEENVIHRVQASKLYADARLSFYKAISEASKSSTDSKALDTTYLQFIASIKLKDKPASKHYLDELSEIDNKLVINYSKMLLFNMNALYKESLLHAEVLLSKSNFSVGALYYAAFSMLKMHKIKEADALISEAIKYISTPSVLALRADIENYGKI
jgi:hypothetical protein